MGARKRRFAPQSSEVRASRTGAFRQLVIVAACSFSRSWLKPEPLGIRGVANDDRAPGDRDVLLVFVFILNLGEDEVRSGIERRHLPAEAVKNTVGSRVATGQDLLLGLADLIEVAGLIVIINQKLEGGPVGGRVVAPANRDEVAGVHGLRGGRFQQRDQRVGSLLAAEDERVEFDGHRRLAVVADSGKLLRLKNLGFPISENSKTYGDLLVRIKVELPQKLTNDEKELFKKLASHRSTKNN